MASSESMEVPPRQTSGHEDYAGCGAYTASTLCTNPACDSASQFVTQLYGLPTVHCIFHLYGQVKASNRLLNGSLNALETAAAAIVKPIHSRLEEQVAVADKQAARCVEAVSQKYPVFQGNPTNLVETIKIRSMRTAQKGARLMVRSFAGQLLFKGVDLSLRATLCAGAYLETVANPPESEVAPASSSETAPTESPPTDAASRPPLTVIQSITKACQAITLPSPVRKAINVPVILLKRLTSLLKRFRHILRRIEGRKRRSHRHGSEVRSPERQSHIETRRKITPKKRSSSGVFQRVKLTAQRLLGMKQVINPTLDKAVMTSSLDTKGSDADKKRKHDDILTEDSDDSIYNFDMENYKSEDDPDFESPSEYSSTDSMEYGDGDTESDIEFEEAYVDQTLIVKQIKEKSASKDDKVCKETIPAKDDKTCKETVPAKSQEPGKCQEHSKEVPKSQQDTKGQLDSKNEPPKSKPDAKGQLDSKTVEKAGHVDTSATDPTKGKDPEKTVTSDIKKGKETEKTDKKAIMNGHPEKIEVQNVAKSSVDAKGKQQSQPAPAKDGKATKQGTPDSASSKAPAKPADGQPVSADTRKN